MRITMTMLRIGLASLLTILPAGPGVQAQAGMQIMSTHHSGKIVALRAGESVWTASNIYLMTDAGDGEWRPRATIKAQQFEPFIFVGDYLLIGRVLYDLEGQTVGEPLDHLELIQGPQDDLVAVHDDQIAVLPSMFPNPVAVYRATDQGLDHQFTIPLPEDLPRVFGFNRLAFSGDRLAVGLFPIQDQCGALVVHKEDESWKAQPLIFPKICAPSELIAGGDLALEDNRLLIGAHPGIGGGAGQLAIYDWNDGEWTETVSLSRPDQDGDYVSETVLPFAWGARVALQNGRLFTNGGYQTDLERSQGGVRASTIINGFFIVEKQPERWQNIKNVTYNQLLVPFGEYFELRPGRLFIDSPLESGIFIWDETQDGWQHAGIIYPPKPD